MSDSDLAIGHPLREPSGSANVLGGGDVELSTEEKRSEDCNMRGQRASPVEL